MVRKYFISAATVSALALVTCFNAGCGGDEGRRPRSSVEGKDSKREADAKKALQFAKKSGTAEAFQNVVKRFEGTAAADEARLDVARILADQCRAAFGNGDLKGAHALCDESKAMGDPSNAEQTQITLDQIDRTLQ